MEQDIINGAINILGVSASQLKEGWNILNCPFHGDKHPSLSFNTESGFYRCKACGKEGFVVKLNRNKQYDANILTKRLYDEAIKKTMEVTLDTFKVFSEEAYFVTDCVEGLTFLNDRGITKDIARNLKMFYVKKGIITTYLSDGQTEDLKIFDRVFIPLMLHNRIQSFEMRSVTKKEGVQKVLYPKDSNMDFLFEYDKLDITRPVIITEGLMESLLIKKYYDNTSCIYKAIPARSSLIVTQLKYLSSYYNIIYISNNDDTGKRSRNLLKELLNNKIDFYIPPSPYKDLGDVYKAFGFKGVEVFLERKIPYLQYKNFSNNC